MYTQKNLVYQSPFVTHGGYFDPLSMAPSQHRPMHDNAFDYEYEECRRRREKANYYKPPYGSLYGDEGAGNWDYDYRPSRVAKRREEQRGGVKSIDEDLYDDRNRIEEQNRGFVPINNREVKSVRERGEAPRETVVRRVVEEKIKEAKGEFEGELRENDERFEEKSKPKKRRR